MKAFDNGCLFSVEVSYREVREFKSKWPCSGLLNQTHWFQFDKRNGDIVNLKIGGKYTDNGDGPALVALSQDAMAYGVKRLKLTI